MIAKLIFEAVLSEASEGRQIQQNKKIDGKQVSYLEGCRDLLELLKENELYKQKRKEASELKTRQNRMERERSLSHYYL